MDNNERNKRTYDEHINESLACFATDVRTDGAQVCLIF